MSQSTSQPSLQVKKTIPFPGEPLLGLAPMAGLTDWPMRALCYEMGATYACSEMVSAMGYLCAKPGNPAYRRLLETHPSESNTACQLFGRDPVVLGEAAARVTALGRFTSLDINMGCPARKIVASGEGSALLKTPDLAYRLMEAVQANTYLPVTVKTRLGYDSHTMNAHLLIEAAESLGLAWVCVHGRTQQQQYRGQADYQAIAALRAQARIPILANGDVATGADALRILAETGAQGLMIGRAAMGNPWLFAMARHALHHPEAPPLPPPTPQAKAALALRHARWMADFKGEALGIVEMRKHVGHYISGMRGATSLRRSLYQVKTLAELTALLAQWTGLAEEEAYIL